MVFGYFLLIAHGTIGAMAPMKKNRTKGLQVNNEDLNLVERRCHQLVSLTLREHTLRSNNPPLKNY